MKAITPEQAVTTFRREPRFQLPVRPARVPSLKVTMEADHLLLRGPRTSVRLTGVDASGVKRVLDGVNGGSSIRDIAREVDFNLSKVEAILCFLSANGFVYDYPRDASTHSLTLAASMRGETMGNTLGQPERWLPWSVRASSSGRLSKEVARLLLGHFAGKIADPDTLSKGEVAPFQVVITEGDASLIPGRSLGWILPVRIGHDQTFIGPLVHYSRVGLLTAKGEGMCSSSVPASFIASHVLREMTALSSNCLEAQTPNGMIVLDNYTFSASVLPFDTGIVGLSAERGQNATVAQRYEIAVRSQSHRWISPQKRFFQYGVKPSRAFQAVKRDREITIPKDLSVIIDGTFGIRCDGHGYIPSAGNLHSVYPLVCWFDEESNEWRSAAYRTGSGYSSVEIVEPPNHRSLSSRGSERISLLAFAVDFKSLKDKYGDSALRLGALDVGVAFQRFSELAIGRGWYFTRGQWSGFKLPEENFCFLAFEMQRDREEGSV